MSQQTAASETIPRAGGTYALLLHLADAAAITIGRLGTFAFSAGWYVYVGSAFGPGGLAGRLSHHLHPAPKPHWHIDYLRQQAIIREIWLLADPVRFEHAWAERLKALPGARFPAPRFGASDCRCPAHLIGFDARPQFADFSQHIPQGQRLVCLRTGG